LTKAPGRSPVGSLTSGSRLVFGARNLHKLGRSLPTDKRLQPPDPGGTRPRAMGRSRASRPDAALRGKRKAARAYRPQPEGLFQVAEAQQKGRHSAGGGGAVPLHPRTKGGALGHYGPSPPGPTMGQPSTGFEVAPCRTRKALPRLIEQPRSYLPIEGSGVGSPRLGHSRCGPSHSPRPRRSAAQGLRPQPGRVGGRGTEAQPDLNTGVSGQTEVPTQPSHRCQGKTGLVTERLVDAASLTAPTRGGGGPSLAGREVDPILEQELPFTRERCLVEVASKDDWRTPKSGRSPNSSANEVNTVGCSRRIPVRGGPQVEQVYRNTTTVDHYVLQPPFKPNSGRGRTATPGQLAGDSAEHPQPLRVGRPWKEPRPHSGHSRTNPSPTSGIQPRLLG
jgi:hypothetical protein